MSAPVNTARVINHVLQRDPIIANDLMLKLAGGSLEQWLPSMKGHMASCIVQTCNAILKDDGKALASEGIKSEKWRLVTVHEANRREAEFNLRRADAHLKNAFKSIEAIVNDLRAPKRFRDDATAWLELIKEPQQQFELTIMTEFATDIADEIGKHAPLKLVRLS